MYKYMYPLFTIKVVMITGYPVTGYKIDHQFHCVITNFLASDCWLTKEQRCWGSYVIVPVHSSLC